MARLMIFDDRVRGLDLPDHAIIVGRSKRVDVPISDRILSRKHCSIIPMESGCSIVDLKSQNGTFVNGSRIDKAELEYDDVIEIGETVIVILDTDSWERGEGLTRLRNPVKAQDLIQRINRKTVPVSDLAPGAGVAAGRSSRDELIEELVMRRLAVTLAEEDPRLDAIAGKVVEKMLEEGWPGKGLDSTRERVRELLVGLEGLDGQDSDDDGPDDNVSAVRE
ncbi:MAG: FHA domain-containing protein [Planctomycetota bacterium]|nr:FHA domain-containing protein [Planctomycetota bacterium]|tara:strand:- start:1928 stop:2593 length:666 start_codon:yes stop_codon:yes gene_type:complete